MSSLIEQAAQRLGQLRRAGVTIPDGNAGVRTPAASAGAAPFAAKPERASAPTVTSRRIDLDLQVIAASGIVTPSSPRSLTGDQFRIVKRPLIRNAMRKGASTLARGNLVMVTSALTGEGKSFTSVNLAMSIAAELDHTVMLVDADVARPSVLRMLGAEAAAQSAPGIVPGLLDVLEGRTELSGALLKTNVDKLTVLPSGTPHARATELLASDAMNLLLDDLATRYPDRIIIFDSPPLLLTTEARVLASHVGQVVLVVQAGRTLQSQVQSALATIESCPVRLLLLNQARAAAAAEDGHGYGYGYGYGYDRGSAAASLPQEAPSS